MEGKYYAKISGPKVVGKSGVKTIYFEKEEDARSAVDSFLNTGTHQMENRIEKGGPTYERISRGVFRLEITDTQRKKSTINANKMIQEVFLEGGLVDFSAILPGEKSIMPCELLIGGDVIETKVSLLIPKRRGESRPEPRFWPYKLSGLTHGGMSLWFMANNGRLVVKDSYP